MAKGNLAMSIYLSLATVAFGTLESWVWTIHLHASHYSQLYFIENQKPGVEFPPRSLISGSFTVYARADPDLLVTSTTPRDSAFWGSMVNIAVLHWSWFWEKHCG